PLLLQNLGKATRLVPHPGIERRHQLFAADEVVLESDDAKDKLIARRELFLSYLALVVHSSLQCDRIFAALESVKNSASRGRSQLECTPGSITSGGPKAFRSNRQRCARWHRPYKWLGGM